MSNCYRHQMFFPLESSVRIVLTGKSIQLYPNGVLLSYSKVEFSRNPATIAGFSVYKKTKPHLRLRFNLDFVKDYLLTL